MPAAARAHEEVHRADDQQGSAQSREVGMLESLRPQNKDVQKPGWRRAARHPGIENLTKSTGAECWFPEFVARNKAQAPVPLYHPA
eukprot:1158385-Pelagomonas_calceolata.AAC.5